MYGECHCDELLVSRKKCVLDLIILLTPGIYSFPGVCPLHLHKNDNLSQIALLLIASVLGTQRTFFVHKT